MKLAQMLPDNVGVNFMIASWNSWNIKIQTRKIVAEQNGYILGLVLVFFVVFTIMGLAFIKMSGHERIHSLNYYNKVRAYHHAEAGIYKALWLVNKVSAAAATFSNSTVSVVYDSVNLEIVATGSAGNAQKSIRVTLYYDDPWPYVLYTDTDILQLAGGEGTITGDIHSNFDVDISKYHTINGTVTDTPTVAAPTVDWGFFEDVAIDSSQYITTKGKVFDAAGSPYTGVWYSTKSVKIDSYAVINGTLVSEENVEFIGDSLTITATPSNYPAIIAGKSIKAKGATNAQVTGFVYSDNKFEPKGDDSTFKGAIVASAKIQTKAPSGQNKVITYDTTYTKNLAGIDVSDWPYVLYTDTDSLDMASGNGTITGDIHSNFGVYVFISKYHTVTGTVTDTPYVAPPVVDWLFFENEAKAVSQYITTKGKVFDVAGGPYSGVWYSTKSVKIDSDAVINGTLVSEENVEFKGDSLTVTATPSNYPAIIAGKSIKAKVTNAQVKGFVYCDNTFEPKGDELTFIGAIVAITKIKTDKGPSGQNRTIIYDSTYVTNVKGIDFNLSSGSTFRILKWQEL